MTATLTAPAATEEFTVLLNTLRTVESVWSDPGDYPSGAGQYALPDAAFVEDVPGSIQFRASLDVIQCRDYLEELLQAEAPDGVTVTEWEITHGSFLSTATVADFEAEL